MAEVLAFPRRLAAAQACPTIRAANHAAAATQSFCEARRALMAGESRAAVSRNLDENGVLACLVLAAGFAIELIGDPARDGELGAALTRWLDASGRPTR